MSMYVVEARDEDGKLILDKDRQPPFTVASDAQLWEYFYNNNPGNHTTSPERRDEWYVSKGWHIRKKTW